MENKTQQSFPTDNPYETPRSFLAKTRRMVGSVLGGTPAPGSVAGRRRAMGAVVLLVVANALARFAWGALNPYEFSFDHLDFENLIGWGLPPLFGFAAQLVLALWMLQHLKISTLSLVAVTLSAVGLWTLTFVGTANPVFTLVANGLCSAGTEMITILYLVLIAERVHRRAGLALGATLSVCTTVNLVRFALPDGWTSPHGPISTVVGMSVFAGVLIVTALAVYALARSPGAAFTGPAQRNAVSVHKIVRTGRFALLALAFCTYAFWAPADDALKSILTHELGDEGIRSLQWHGLYIRLAIWVVAPLLIGHLLDRGYGVVILAVVAGLSIISVLASQFTEPSLEIYLAMRVVSQIVRMFAALLISFSVIVLFGRINFARVFIIMSLWIVLAAIPAAMIRPLLEEYAVEISNWTNGPWPLAIVFQLMFLAFGVLALRGKISTGAVAFGGPKNPGHKEPDASDQVDW